MFFLEEDIENILDLTKRFKQYFGGKKILLTGGNGFLGKYITEIFYRYNQLNSKQIKLIVVDNLITGEKNVLQSKYSGFKFLKRDACKPFKNFEKVDLILHAAGIASPYYYRKKPLETLNVAIEGTKNVLELAKESNSKLVFFSSSEVYGDPAIDKIPIKESYRGNVSSTGPRACYDESKRVGETLCYIYNTYFHVHTNIIRPFNIYGPGMSNNDYRVLPNFINNIVNDNKLLVYGSGKQTRTYCYISDAINGILRIMKYGKSGEIYNIGNSKPEISVLDLTKKLSKLSSKKIEYKIINYPSSYPEDEPQRRCPDLSKAKKHLNFNPNISIEEGLRKYLQWGLENY